MKTITNIIYPTFALFTLACFALLPQARAVCQDACLANNNTVQGDDALLNNTGFNNTAVGFEALLDNTTGFSNTATGAFALLTNTNGFFNTANGNAALNHNTGGSNNTAIGVDALFNNTTGYNNTASGFGALTANTTGNNNTAVGYWALIENTVGDNNTANGFEALLYNTTGDNNTAEGFRALHRNSTGSNNIALGNRAGLNLTTGSENIDIGNLGVADESGIIRIGTPGSQTATFIAGIRESPIAVGVAVGITIDGQLGVRASSARFKEAIKPMGKGSEALFSLKPVSFRYRKEIDPAGNPQFGLVAEEVDKVDPDLVVHDDQGKPYTVRYEAVNAMLLNEFLKEHCEVQALRKQVEALTAGLQKVNAELEIMKQAPQMVSR